jgi:hypothetical protein
MNKELELEKIRAAIGEEVSVQEVLTLDDMFDDWLEQAMNAANRTGEPPKALLAIVRDTVVAAWRRRGDEGINSTSTGGQSYSYVDLQQDMAKRIIRANLRVFRP